jgi:membrane-bound serine protease (ClpP class)
MDFLTLAYILIAIGVILMMVELFIPTGGICFLLASVFAIAGISLVFSYGSATNGIIALVAIFVVFPLMLAAFFFLWPEMLWGRRLIPKPEDDMTVAAMPANAQLEILKGRVGKSISQLRPAGVVEFEGKRIDCITEGMMIDADQWVRCVGVKAGRVIVRQIDKPNLDGFENQDFG